MQEAAQVSVKLGKARGHLEDTLYPWSPRDAIARLNPGLPVALRTADWPRVIQLVNAANLSQNMPHMEFLAGGLSQFALGMQSVEAHEPDVAERHSVLLDSSLWRMSQQIKDQEAKEKKAAAPTGNQSMSPDPLPQPLLKMLSIMSLELRASMLATQNNVPEAEKLFASARREEKELGYHEPPFYIRPVAESEAAAMMTAGKWPEAKAAFQRGAGGASQLWFRALWAGPGDGEGRRCRRYHGGLQAVPQRVEDGGPGIARDATCAAVGEPTRWGWSIPGLIEQIQTGLIRNLSGALALAG